MSPRLNTLTRVTVVGILMNALMAAYKMIVGVLAASPALFADGVHSLSDLLCNGFVYFAGRYAHQDPDHDHPYGHWRYETFATICLGIFLMVVGTCIVYEGLYRLWHHEFTHPQVTALYAATLSVITNEWVFRYTLKAAKLIRSDMLKANAYHSRADSLSSVIVLLGLIASLSGIRAMDAIASDT